MVPMKRVCAGFLMAALATPVAVYAQATYSFNLPAQALSESLRELGSQTRINVIFDPAAIDGRKAPALKGSYEPKQALTKLLQGTNLVAEFTGSTSVIIKPLPATQPRSSAPSPQSASQTSESTSETKSLGAIEVIGNFRREPLDRFAGSISPLTGLELNQMGANSMQDFLGAIPGVSFAALMPGFSNITIRGIGTTTGTDQGQQTTGIYVDGIPLSEAYFNLATPDVDTFDMDQVVVLKGPQGTSFGTGALGGAVNYIPNQPDTSGSASHFQLGLDQVDGNGSLGHVAKGMVNIPVNDRFAIRVVLNGRRDPGYIDNKGTGRDDANVANIFGGRLLASWYINDTTTLSWMTLYQKIKDADAFNDRSLTGVFKTDTLIPQPFDTSVLINSLKFDHKFAGADLLVHLSAHRKVQHSNSDVTDFFAGLFGGLLTGPAVAPQIADVVGSTTEVRLTSNSNDQFQWLVGGIYDEGNIKYDDTFAAKGSAAAIDSIYGSGLGAILAPDDVFWIAPLRVRGQQTALYSQVSWAFNPRWKLTLGGRYYRTKVTSTQGNSGLLTYLTTNSLEPSYLTGAQAANGLSPMMSLAYQASQNTMVYGLVSTGFRFGGPNDNPPQGTASTPGGFGPDKLINYELGLRTSNEAKTLTASVTGYFDKWSKIQLRTFTPLGLAYAINAGDAYSYGVDNSLVWQPNRHIEWRGSLSLNLAKLVQPYEQSATLVAPSGTPLPGASKWSASSIATYRFDGQHHPFITATFQYRSSATVDLFNLQPKMGNYQIFGLRGGLVAGGVTYTAYVENIGNKKGISNLAIYALPDLYRYYVPPRTVGILADFAF